MPTQIIAGEKFPALDHSPVAQQLAMNVRLLSSATASDALNECFAAAARSFPFLEWAVEDHPDPRSACGQVCAAVRLSPTFDVGLLASLDSYLKEVIDDDFRKSHDNDSPPARLSAIIDELRLSAERLKQVIKADDACTVGQAKDHVRAAGLVNASQEHADLLAAIGPDSGTDPVDRWKIAMGDGEGMYHYVRRRSARRWQALGLGG